MSERNRQLWNACRFAEDGAGHYESYFQRANHPERPLGFWIRYTVFAPKGRPDDAVGELWAIYFDGETDTITAVKEVVPWAECRFSKGSLDAQVGESVLSATALNGSASSGGHRLGWSLEFTSPEEPLLLFPDNLYGGPFPKAKALVGSPNAVFSGSIDVDGTAHDIDGWVGSQNHNWGSKHTDAYAWGQVAQFDEAPNTFLECSTARVKVGPLWTPWMTLMVLRLEGREYRLNSIQQALRAKGRYDFFSWRFESSTSEIAITGQIAASPRSFVGLPYDNPPGGRKTCINSKIARCQLTVRLPGKAPRTLLSEHRAAFEILTDATDHGVPVLPA